MGRRALAKTESAIRASDPRLASTLDVFGWLNRAEEMPQTEQLPGHHRLSLRSLPLRLAARRVLRARSLNHLQRI
jgi:hypothetical protein